MLFQSPELLWLLLLLPVLVGVYIWAQRRRARFAIRFSSLALIREALDKGPGIRRHIPPFFFLLGIAAMLLGLARPTGVLFLPKEQATVILTMDVSGSMRANDMKPSRLEAAKTAARAFVAQQDSNLRIGIVSFSSNAAVVQAPTNDRQAVLAAINRLSTQQSTAIGSGILTSLDALSEKPGATPARRDDALGAPTPTPTPVPPGTHTAGTIILLTDGQNRMGPSPTESAQKAADRGVRVFTIGVGTPQGSTIETGGGFGFRAILDEDTLKRIAGITDARYYHASDEAALVEIYQKLDKEVIVQKEQEESTVLFAFATFGLFLLSGCLSLFWFNRLP